MKQAQDLYNYSRLQEEDQRERVDDQIKQENRMRALAAEDRRQKADEREARREAFKTMTTPEYGNMQINPAMRSMKDYYDLMKTLGTDWTYPPVIAGEQVPNDAGAPPKSPDIPFLIPRENQPKRIGTQIYERDGNYYVPTDDGSGNISFQQVNSPGSDIYKTTTRPRPRRASKGRKPSSVDSVIEALRRDLGK